MELSRQERELLDELAQDLRHRFGATDVRLYGSVAREELAADSDIDLFVVVPHLTWLVEQAICDRCYEVTLACGRLVAPCVVSQEELTGTPLRVSPLIRAVEQKSVAI
jgi:tRNA nucleotidyltransferase (CCA-adding enzyme)